MYIPVSRILIRTVIFLERLTDIFSRSSYTCCIFTPKIKGKSECHMADIGIMVSSCTRAHELVH